MTNNTTLKAVDMVALTMVFPKLYRVKSSTKNKTIKNKKNERV
jgi:hypothetical protein